MPCETCKFSSPRPAQKTYLQAWQEDTRPVAPNIFAWLWDPQKYKDKHPYGINDFVESLDKMTEEKNERLVYCDRYPRCREVSKYYECGEFKPR